MRDGEPLSTMLGALDGARPDNILTVLGQVLGRQFGATSVRVLLADYQLATLRPIDTHGESADLDGSAAGEAFTTQEPVTRTTRAGEVHVHLPMSVGGDRLGILQLAMPGPLVGAQLGQLTDLATLAGYALNATSRQTDLLHRAARSQRMTLAAELQWQLIPARGRIASEYQLAGHLEPAYGVHADNFDWSEDEGTLLVSITDATNHARSTPLLTTLAVTATRNARRAGLDIADQASMADQAVYAHHQGAHSVDVLLMGIDMATGRASVVKAGSPELLLIRDGHQHPIELVDQIPLGMFEASDYAPQSFDLATGDRLVLMSDGVADALSVCGEANPRDRLHEILDAAREDQPARVVRLIVDALIDNLGAPDLADDATVVCLDWSGPGRSSGSALSAPSIAVPGRESRLRAVPAVRSGAADWDDSPTEAH